MAKTIKLPLPEADNATINTLLGKLEDLSKRNKELTSHFESNRRLGMISEAVPPFYHNLKLVLGWSGKAINYLARRCILDGVNVPENTAVIWEALAAGNAFATEVANAIHDSLLYGVGFLVTTAATSQEIATGAPRVLTHATSALNSTGTWNPRLRRLDNLLIVHDRDRYKQPISLTLHQPGLIITAERSEGRWTVNETSHGFGMLAEPLIYRPRPGKPLGTSRLTKAMRAHQDQGIRELIRHEAHMDRFSFPEYWLLGADASLFEDNTRWRNGLLAGNAIPDDDQAEDRLARVDVKQFPASDPDPHLKALSAVGKLFAREAGLPDSAVSMTDYANPISAEAYDASQYELIHEAEGATQGWTPAIRRVTARMLAMAGQTVELTDITPLWRNPRHLTRSAQADAGLKQVKALPWLADTKIGLELIGLTPDQIARATAEKQAAQARAQEQELAAALAGNNGLPEWPGIEAMREAQQVHDDDND